jgi:pyruvate formate lyase activating enzyme
VEKAVDSLRGIIFNIQRFTVHDGPGIRTEIFLKGCHMWCRWCGNPESQSLRPEVGVYATKCIGADVCGMCLEACPLDDCLQSGRAVATGAEKTVIENAVVAVDREKCTGCMACVEACPADALKQWGEEMTVAEVIKVIEADRDFYGTDGGVTLSGGDPLMQPEFCHALLLSCRQKGIGTCLESEFQCDWERVKNIRDVVDIFISDIKIMDSEKHRRWTGAGNERILENLKRLSQTDSRIMLRLPLIPGINDDAGNLDETARFILEDMKGRVEILQILGFMRLGEEKYTSLGLAYPMHDLNVDKDALNQKIKDTVEFFNAKGIPCSTKGSMQKND